MLLHKNIELALNTDYYDIRHLIPYRLQGFLLRAIDRFFDYKFGSLSWRSFRFENRVVEVKDFQGAAVMNYPDEDVSYTRIHEFKHLHPERAVLNKDRTLISYEYPLAFHEDMERYYPVNDPENQAKLKAYETLAAGKKGVVLGGRLGAYKYWDMDKAIENALSTFDALKEHRGEPHA